MPSSSRCMTATPTPTFCSHWTGRKRSLTWLQWPRSGFPVYQAPISYRESGGISARDQCELALDAGNDLMALESEIETSSGASLTRVVPHQLALVSLLEHTTFP